MNDYYWKIFDNFNDLGQYQSFEEYQTFLMIKTKSIFF